jgi:hypothetical protein
MYLKYQYHLVEWTTSLRVVKDGLACSTATLEKIIPVATRIAKQWFTHLITTEWDNRTDPDFIVDLEPLKPFQFENGMKVQIPTTKTKGSLSIRESLVVQEARHKNLPFLVIWGANHNDDEYSIRNQDENNSEIFSAQDLQLYIEPKKIVLPTHRRGPL